MFKSLEVFKISHAMASHAARQQAVVARNIANADTPGYAARVLPEFEDIVGHHRSTARMHTTRPGHFGSTLEPAAIRPEDAKGHTSPNGNGVSLEEEMIKAVNVKRQHDRALAIYKSSLKVLRTSLGRQ
ncbi:FlgB family protein [Shimia aestuarii]|uniref:Flagellar basal-body rod protein FlgB n=1 Tax=Shimia aestuarii TaxID=254406 RepID=A0A1I4K909_9RHOB|nr:FlgB family protein [Shimia aestuarii]SFL75109.1 flagellar basal-body rod protein FlgB [Shimia aestuarii]